MHHFWRVVQPHKTHWDKIYELWKNSSEDVTINQVKSILERDILDYVSRQYVNDSSYIVNVISTNAYKSFVRGNLNELIADSILLYRKNRLNDDYLIELLKKVGLI